ncbi:uncharacterized protein [Tenebrio molitor]|uniref:uncharacterized protein isoform X1 n=1 Tax=Tenebrio molitor TaxID=7067 RepID=UPI0036249282
MSSPLIFLLLFLAEISEEADLNVGTTLFTKADSCKECWSSESMALLTSRMILEDLLPSTSILVIDSNEFVTDLVEYFRLILEIVRQETHGKTKHITLLALTDLLGGYLHHAVLPIAKYAYYAGLIDFDSMATLLGLFDELKWFLRTNGQGWSKSLSVNLENFEIQRIPLQPPIPKDECNNLIFIEDENADEKQTHCDLAIAMPFFDSITKPSAIAFPMKSCPLYNVEANSSSYLVMKFFVTAYKCLQQKNAKSESVQRFQNDFCGWIEEQIMPRLEDEKFYAAFGGVLRVRNTLKRLGMTQSNNLDKQIDEFRHAAEVQNLAPTGHQMSRSSMILLAVLITIFVWFILGTMFICYKMRQSREQTCGPPEDGEKTTTCTSLVSSKYFYPEKLKSTKTNRGTSTPETETSELDLAGYHERRRSGKTTYPLDSLHYHKLNWLRDQGGQRQEITIKTCRCREDEDEEEEEDEVDEDTLTPTSAALAASSHTEGRLPSITEMSEQSTSDRRTPSQKNRTSPGGSTTTDNRRNRVVKQVYVDSETETEETSEPA